MTVGAGIEVVKGNLVVLENTILHDVHDNIMVTPADGNVMSSGAFIGVHAEEKGSRMVFPVGKLEGLRFMSLFRFKLWWMTQRMGTWGHDVPFETQFLIVEGRDASQLDKDRDEVLYVVFLPILEGDFRAVLQGNEMNEIEICLESGCPEIEEFEGSHLVFVAAGSNPFDVITNAVNFANRLTHIKENHKFQKDGKDGHRVEDPALGLCHVIRDIKDKHPLKYIFVWHALTGYWGGVNPEVDEMKHYESKIRYPVASPGVNSNEPDVSLDCITKNGLGLVNPERVFNFYNELHSYLASAGIDGVKVDVQNILETLGAGHGGRVKLARKYHQALEASILRNFPDNAMISCMSHNTDGLYSAKRAAVIRASDDFWPRDPASHTIHIASVAYNTVFLGEFMQPDWDMFHSLHPMAEYHGAARSVGGCAIYVSDKPGHHDFNLLWKLVLPDGSILRAKLPGRPTRDCLFFRSCKRWKNCSLLKIWNLNDFTGVVGVFNCQGAGWCKFGKRNIIHDQQPGTITGQVRAKDVEYLQKVADDGWNGDAVLYSHVGAEVIYTPQDASVPVTLSAREYEIFTVVPVVILPNGARFAPIGLIKMFNSGGAIKELNFESKESAIVKMKVRGCGLFGAYSSVQPKRILVDSGEVEFEYNNGSGLVTLSLSVSDKELYLWSIKIEL